MFCKGKEAEDHLKGGAEESDEEDPAAELKKTIALFESETGAIKALTKYSDVDELALEEQLTNLHLWQRSQA